MKKLAYFLLAVFLLIPFASATWNIQVKSFPQSLSLNAQGVLWANITDSSGKPINPENCSQYAVTYNDSKTVKTMNFIGNGIWIAEYATNSLPVNVLVVSGQGNCYGTFDSGSATESLPSWQSLDISILNFPSVLPKGKSVTIEANVSYNGNVTKNGNVYLKILDLKTDSVKLQDKMNYSNGKYVKTISIPKTLSNFSLSVNASAAINGSTLSGANGKLFYTVENLEGIVNISGPENKCNSIGCELGSRVYVNYTEQIGKPDYVEVVVWGNKIIKELNLTNYTLNNLTIWKNNFLIPKDFNLSNAIKSGDNYSINVNITAKNKLVSRTYSKTLYLYTFIIHPISKYYVSRGESLDLGFEVTTPISGIHLNKNDLSEFNVSIYYVNKNNLISVKNYTINDTTYSDDIFHINYTVPPDTATGSYEVICNALDIYGHKPRYSIPAVFDVVEQVNSGPIIINRTSINQIFYGPGIYKEYLLFNNTDNNRVIVRPIVLGNISKILFGKFVLDENDPSVDSDYVIEGHNKKVFVLGYNITNESLRKYTGTLVVRVFSDLQGTVEKSRAEIPLSVKISSNMSNGNLSINVNKISLIYSDEGSYTKNISVLNLGHSKINVSVSIEGNVSEITSVNPNFFELNGSSIKYVIFTQTVDSSDNGYYKGYYVFNSSENQIKVPVEATVDISGVIKGKLKVNLIGNGSLGLIVKGDVVNFTANIRNIGEVNLTDFSVSSATGTNPFSSPDFKNLELLPGKNKTVTISLKTDVLPEGSQTRKIVISASPDAQNFTQISLKIITNYKDKFLSLNNSIDLFNEDLKNINSSELISNKTQVKIKLVNLSLLINQGVAEWNLKHYNKSKSIYRDATKLKNEISSDILSLKNYVPSPSPAKPPSNKKVLVFVFVLIILIVVGIIIYLSIVPG